jgi:hypothetical protein
MPAKSKTKKLTPAKIKDQVEKILKVIEKNKREYEGKHFTGLTAEEIERKLKRVNSPMIVSQGWNSTTPGGTVNYNLGIFNPDPTQAIWLFAHVWVGSGNVDPVTGTFLLNVDTRFPRLTQPIFDGLTLASGASGTLSFALFKEEFYSRDMKKRKQLKIISRGNGGNFVKRSVNQQASRADIIAGCHARILCNPHTSDKESRLPLPCRRQTARFQWTSSFNTWRSPTTWN